MNCQRERVLGFSPQRQCDHGRDFTIVQLPSERQIALCGCCFLELWQMAGGYAVRVVIDVRTGMQLAPWTAAERAARLN